jgi:hypothetical protein
MSAVKQGSQKTAKRSASKRWVKDTHVIDYEPESPAIRENEAVERRRRGFRNAMRLIAAMLITGIGWVAWHEALEKNEQFLLKKVEVNTTGTLTRGQIVAATGLTTATNVLTMNLRDARAKIERLPQVKSVVIKRDYHGKLTLDVVQRIPVAWIECAKHRLMEPLSGKGCLIDVEGALVPCEVITKECLVMPRIQFPGLSVAELGRVVPDFQLHSALRLMKKLQSRAGEGSAKLERIEIPNAWSLVAYFSGETRITFGVDDLDPQLVRFDRFIYEAKARKWRVATLNLLSSINTPVTFHEPPDVTGLTLAENASSPTAR